MPAKICIPIVGPSQSAAQAQVARACELGDLIELCLDRLGDVDLKLLLASASKPVILTYRSVSQGGSFGGSPSEHARALEELAQLLPAYVDVEEGREVETSCVPIIRSRHDLGGVGIETSLQGEGAIYKYAGTCRSGIEALQLAKKASASTIAVGMGEDGLLSRVLNPVMGGPFTFAALDRELTSANGQPTVELLRRVYGYDRLGPSTKILGVVGDPVAQSLSPVVHNAVFRRAGIDAVYVPIRVPQGELESFFEVAHDFPFVGLSVTMPHKEDVLSWASEGDERAQAIGAVNTLACRDGVWCATNTDAIGALDAIEARRPIDGLRLAVLGAGGAARAIAYEAVQRGAQVTVYNRTLSKAKDLAENFGCEWGRLGDDLHQDVVVQATSVGMEPNVEATPIKPSCLSPGSLVMDIIARPEKTRFLQEAQARGCEVIRGREMFIRQAVHQLLFWFPEQISARNAEKWIETSLK